MFSLNTSHSGRGRAARAGEGGFSRGERAYFDALFPLPGLAADRSQRERDYKARYA
jgi:hypothetical protein